MEVMSMADGIVAPEPLRDAVSPLQTSAAELIRLGHGQSTALPGCHLLGASDEDAY
jgi:hypothetical protein